MMFTYLWQPGHAVITTANQTAFSTIAPMPAVRAIANAPPKSHPYCRPQGHLHRPLSLRSCQVLPERLTNPWRRSEAASWRAKLENGSRRARHTNGKSRRRRRRQPEWDAHADVRNSELVSGMHTKCVLHHQLFGNHTHKIASTPRATVRAGPILPFQNPVNVPGLHVSHAHDQHFLYLLAEFSPTRTLLRPSTLRPRLSRQRR